MANLTPHIIDVGLSIRINGTEVIGNSGVITSSDRFINGTAEWRFGTGSPEGVVTAPVGSFYSRTNGGTGTSLYIKESGAGNTGWVAVSIGGGGGGGVSNLQEAYEGGNTIVTGGTTGGFDISGTEAFSIDGAQDSNITVTGSGQDLTLSVAGGGAQALFISSAGTVVNAIDINASAGGIEMTAGASNDLILGARGATIPLNEVGEESLSVTSFTATSIIGALNELAAGGGGGGGGSQTLAQTLALGNSTGANDIVISSGQQISGGFANFGSASGATANGDLAAGDGTRELTWDVSANNLEIGVARTGTVAVGTADFYFVTENASNTFKICHINSSSAPQLFLDRVKGTASSPASVANTDTLGGIQFGGWHSSLGGGGFAYPAAIYARVDGTPTGSDQPARLEFATSDTGDGLFGIVRWRMTPSGDFIPHVTDIYDIGSTANVVNTVYSLAVDSDAALTIGGTNATALTLGRSAVGVSMPSWLNIGSATDAVAAGDFAAGDGTNTLFWDANQNELFVGEPLGGNLANTTANYIFNADVAGNTLKLIRSSTASVTLDFIKSRGDSATPTIYQNGDAIAEITFKGYVPAIAGDSTGALARISCIASEAPSGTSTPGQLTISTTSSGSTSVTQRWIFDDNGDFLASAETYNIGTATANRPGNVYAATSLNVANGATTITSNNVDSGGALTVGGTSATSLTLGRSTVGVSMPSWLNLGTTTQAVAVGDFATGSSTRNVFFDESIGRMTITSDVASGRPLDVVTSGTTAEAAFFQASSKLQYDSVATSTLRISQGAASGDGVLGDGPGIVFSGWDGVSGYQGAFIQSYKEVANTAGVRNDLTALVFGTNSGTTSSSLSIKWQISSAGHLIPWTTNVYDIGVNGGTRPRSLYLTNAIIAGGAASIGGALDADYLRLGTDTNAVTAGDLSTGVNANRFMFFNSATGRLQVESNTASVAIYGNNSSTGEAAFFSATNEPEYGDAKSTIRISGDGGGGGAIGTGSGLVFSSFNGATGTQGSYIKTYKENGTSGTHLYSMVFGTNNGSSATDLTDKWAIDSSGHFKPWANNTRDLGTSSLNVRTGYFATSLNIGSGATTITSNNIDSSGALNIGATNATSIGLGRSGIVATSSSQLTWATGLGSINQILGPSDQHLAIRAGGTNNTNIYSGSGVLSLQATSSGVTVGGSRLQMSGSAYITFGNSLYNLLVHGASQTDPNTLMCGLGAVGGGPGSLILCRALHATGKNFGHPAVTNPTLWIQSNEDPAVDNTQWMSFYHDQTNGNIETGTGDLVLNPTDDLISNAHLLFAADDTYNIGFNDGTFTQRPKSIYVGTSVVVGDVVVANSTANSILFGSPSYDCASVRAHDGTSEVELMPDVAKVSESSFSLNNATNDYVDFDTVEIETNRNTSDMVNLGTNADRITPGVGVFNVSGSITYPSSGTGACVITIERFNSSNVSQESYSVNNASVAGGFNTPVAISMPMNFASGDYVKLGCYQNSGGSQNISATLAVVRV